MDGRCEVIDAWHKEQPRASDVYDCLKTWKLKYDLDVVYADKSHPFQNQELTLDHGFYVVEVNFNTEKLRGVGILRNYFEKRMLFIDDKFELLITQLKNWRKDKNGNIRKIDDHYPDALLCAMLEEADMSPLISAADAGGYISEESNIHLDSEAEYWDGYQMKGYDDYDHDPYYDSEF